MAKTASVNFHVVLVGMDAWAAAASNKVTGTLTSFTTVVASHDSVTAN